MALMALSCRGQLSENSTRRKSFVTDHSCFFQLLFVATVLREDSVLMSVGSEETGRSSRGTGKVHIGGFLNIDICSHVCCTTLSAGQFDCDANAMATTSSKSPATPAPQNPANIITALGNAFQSQNGEPITGERIAQLLAQNMGQLGELARQGKLNPQQIQQVRFDGCVLSSDRLITSPLCVASSRNTRKSTSLPRPQARVRRARPRRGRQRPR
jgi:hypothetical protein